MGSRRDDDFLTPILTAVSERWKVASAGEKIGFLLIMGIFCSVIGGCALLARFGEGHSLVHVLKRPGSMDLFWLFVVGVGMLIGAAAIFWKRPVQADPDPRARQVEVQIQRPKDMVWTQHDLATVLRVSTPTIREWCEVLKIEPSYHQGEPWFSREQARLVRLYGQADAAGRREILEGLEEQVDSVTPGEPKALDTQAGGKPGPVSDGDGASDCTACGTWNAPGTEYCGECGAPLEDAEA